MMTWYFDEYERVNRLLKDLYQDPATKFMQDIERSRELLEPPGYRALREWQDSAAADARRTQEMLTSAFSAVVDQHKQLLQSIRSHLAYPESLAAEAQKTLAAFQAPGFPVIESLLDSLKTASRSADLLKQFELTFGGQLLDHAQAIADASDEDFDERAGELTSLLKAHIEQSRGGPVSLEGYIQIILAIVFFIQTFVSSHRFEEESRKHFQSIDAQLKQLTENVGQTSDLRIVSANVLRVRDEPSSKSQLLGKVTLNALVRVLCEEKGWANIEYFDFVEGGSREGWVAKRFLRALPKERDAFVAEASRRVLENSVW